MLRGCNIFLSYLGPTEERSDQSLLFAISSALFEPRHEKTNVLVSDLVRHKPGCAATEDG